MDLRILGVLSIIGVACCTMATPSQAGGFGKDGFEGASKPSFSNIILVQKYDDDEFEDADLKDVVRLIDRERYKKANKMLKAMERRNKKDSDIYTLLAFTSRKIGKYDDAYHYYDIALDIDPNNIRAIEYLGELYVEKGQMKKARQQMARLKKLCPKGCEEIGMLEKSFQNAKLD